MHRLAGGVTRSVAPGDVSCSPSLFRTRSPSRGFTLIELLVAVAIVGVLVAIGVPSMTSYLRDARISSQADLLVATLNSARVESIRRRVNYTVCPAPANPNTDTACSTNAANWSNGFLVYDSSAIVQRVQAKSNLTITTTNTGVVFTATLGSTTAATFSLCLSGANQQQVSVDAAGRVRRVLTQTVCS